MGRGQKPIQKIELSGKNTALRGAAAVLFLVIGVSALGYVASQLFAVPSGWTEIQAGTSEGPTCGEEYVFQYELGPSARSEQRELTRLYTTLCRKLFQLFHTSESFEGVVNLKTLSDRPNEVLTVDPALYRAFEAVQKAKDRTVYLGPIYARYNDLFSCLDDAQAMDFDPRLNPEVAREYAETAKFASDPGSVDVELLENSQVRLRVSEEYLAYAREEGISRFLDFGWLRNAFIADELADALAQAGYTHGAVSSQDGFTRCLDGRGTDYGLPVLAWREDRPIEAGTLEYQGPMSLVSLRAFPAAQGDALRYYQTKSGEIRTLYLDPADGLCRLCASSVVCYAPDQGCAQLAMEAGRVFLADQADVSALSQGKTRFLWCNPGEQAIHVSHDGIAVTNLYDGFRLAP